MLLKLQNQKFKLNFSTKQLSESLKFDICCVVSFVFYNFYLNCMSIHDKTVYRRR